MSDYDWFRKQLEYEPGDGMDTRGGRCVRLAVCIGPTHQVRLKTRLAQVVRLG